MNYAEYIFEKVSELNPVHAKKLSTNFAFFDQRHAELSNRFYQHYATVLKQENKTFDFAIDSYLHMIADMNIETVDFYRTGRYNSSTFEEVNKRVYANPMIMEYYMHGLILSQFLWKHHYEIFTFFVDSLPQYSPTIRNYLEIGAGHGLYLSKALEILKANTVFNVIDVSMTSIELAHKFNNDNRVNFQQNDILEFSTENQYNFITMGEVLEHVEQPFALLRKLHSLLCDDGTLFLTTPTNAPTIDHIYLFNTVEEIQKLIREAGFIIDSERAYMAENVSEDRSRKYKITTLYGAFLKKNIS